MWMFWKRPLTVDAWMSRLALGTRGLQASELDTPAGTMTVWVGGSGPALVLLHGAGDQAGAWARIMEPLVADYRVLAPDLPGHWKSDPRTGPISVGQLLDGLEALMDARCAGEPAIVVGNSMGAWIAFLYAVEHPQQVARLVAINGGPITDEHTGVNILPQTREEARATMKGLLGQHRAAAGLRARRRGSPGAGRDRRHGSERVWCRPEEVSRSSSLTAGSAR
jgi:pimeloyl-ACP methyl ester carboxylesterase